MAIVAAQIEAFGLWPLSHRDRLWSQSSLMQCQEDTAGRLGCGLWPQATYQRREIKNLTEMNGGKNDFSPDIGLNIRIEECVTCG